ncbi:MAG TPA: hypothetical protein VHQ01_12205, partial [Pyrinomonadaceae bacterium]|nr:hypothetical protein [Pyrinomonadaceae bacterium]
MKTLEEIEDWCLGAAEQFGDPAAVTGQIFARYAERPPTAAYSDVLATYDNETIHLSFELGRVFPLRIDLE